MSTQADPRKPVVFDLMTGLAIPSSEGAPNGGFGLVEIVISLGVVSFALIALVGLTMVGLNSSRAAQEDTVVASLARNAVAELKTLGYTRLSTLASTNLYYTYDGAVTNATAAEAYYKCDIRIQSPSGNTPLCNLIVNFSWPLHAANSNVSTFSSSIAEY